MQYAEVSPTHKKEGRGFLQFRLVNMRDPIIMGFLRDGESPASGSSTYAPSSVSIRRVFKAYFGGSEWSGPISDLECAAASPLVSHWRSHRNDVMVM